MKLKHLLLVIILFSLMWTTACSNGSEIEEQFPPSMNGLIHVNDQEYEMKAGGYSWERKEGSGTQHVQTDAASPNQIAEELTAISIKEDSKMTIEVEDSPKLTAYLWNESGRLKKVPLDNDQLSAPSNKGRYIYEVIAKWTDSDVNGEVSYTFVVEVK